MKVKVSLRFRGREMAHKEFGFQVVEDFLKAIVPYGHPDADPKLVGRGINVMISPLPRNKRAANPRQQEKSAEAPVLSKDKPEESKGTSQASDTPAATPAKGFTNNPFASIADGSAADP